MTKYVIPLVVFIVLVVFLAIGPAVIRGSSISLTIAGPRHRAAAVVRFAKKFSAGNEGQSLAAQCLASWCIACREAPSLLEVAAGHRLSRTYYKTTHAATAWLRDWRPVRVERVRHRWPRRH